jgi:hypothetical protein
MQEKSKIDPKNIPTLGQVRKELERRGAFKRTVKITDYDNTKEIDLPDYGEIKIVCHAGKIKTIETTVKEQM